MLRLINKLKKLLLKDSEIRNSADQLVKDFGSDVIPIYSLEKLRQKKFQINFIPFGQRTFTYVSQMMKISKKKQIPDNSKPGIKDLINQTKSNVKSLYKRPLSFFGVIRWFLLTLFLLLFIPMLIFTLLFTVPVIFIYKFYSNGLASSLVSIMKKHKSTFGYVLNDPSYHNDIFIPKRSNKVLSSDVIISHEHIHFLQSQYEYGKKKGRTEDRSLKSIEEFISCQITTKEKSHILYLLSRLEFEARLHEVIIAIINRTGSFPKSRDELLFNLSLNKFFIYAFHKRGMSIEIYRDTYGEKRVFYLRSEEVEKDLFACFVAFKNDRDLNDFVFNAIPTMYANLLMYYGEFDLSDKINSEINSPSIYDQFYKYLAD